MRKAFFLLLNFCIITSLMAQEKPLSLPHNKSNNLIAAPAKNEIRGIVVESQTGAPIVQATVKLLSPKDSIIVTGTTTNNEGAFSIKNITAANYIFSISYIGFESYFKQIKTSDFTTHTLQLPRIKLSETSILLAEAEALGKAPELVVKEDTLEYNPTAFKMEKNAVVEDILKRLPGVEIQSDGKIMVGGKQIKKLYVDGKEFFGNDPTVASKNLPVDIIDRLQVVEKKSDLAILTGVDDGEEETVINLTIKEGMKKGYMLNASAGMGAFAQENIEKAPRYNANVLGSRFRNDDNMTLLFNANNINNQGFTDNGNNAQSSMRGNRGSRGTGTGITNSNSAGFNNIKIFSDALKMGGNILFKNNQQNVIQNSYRENLLIDSVSFVDRKSQSLDNSYSVNLDYKIEYLLNKKTTFIFSPSASYNYSTSQDSSSSATFAGQRDVENWTQGKQINYSNAHSSSISQGYDLGARLDISHKFERKGRRLSFSLSANTSNGWGDGDNNSLTRFTLNSKYNKNFNQESQTKTTTNNYRFYASYVEPVFTENDFLQLMYVVNYTTNNNLKNTYEFDSLSMAYDSLNADFSKSLINKRISQTATVSFRSVREKYQYNIGINLSPEYTESTSYIENGAANHTDSIVHRLNGRNTINYAPQADFTYRFNKNQNLRFTYRGRSRQPSVSQLDPTVNNTNPLNIRSGNPDLFASFSNNIDLRYRSYHRETQRSFTSDLGYTFSYNDIINKTIYQDSTGVRYTSPINENGNWNIRGAITFSTPIGAAKLFQINTTTYGSYRNAIGYAVVGKNTSKNTSKSTQLNETLSLSFRQKWLFIQLIGSARYNNTTNSLEGKLATSNLRTQCNINAQFYLPHTWVIATNIGYTANTGLSSGFNKDELLWNGSISRSLFKNKAGTLRFEMNDILRQKLSIVHNVTGNYIEDVEYNTLTSYFLVSFSYRFNSIGDKKRASFSDEKRGNSYNRPLNRNESR